MSFFIKKIKKILYRPLVSIIIPIYDGTDLLVETVNSVVNQTYKKIEILLICDGSPIETTQIVKGLQKRHKNIRPYFYKDNSGNAVRGRNRGIVEARGEIIIFHDSDDLSLPNRVKETVKCFRDDTVDVVYGGFRYYYDGNRRIDGVIDNQLVMPVRFTFSELKKGNLICSSAAAIRHSVLKMYGGVKTKMKYCEDYELWLRLLYYGAKFHPLEKEVLRLRIHDNNLESSFLGEGLKWRKIANQEYRKIPRKIEA